MTSNTQAPKICPSCRALTPTDEMEKIVSRSSGRTTNSWRCFACIKRKAAAMHRAKVQHGVEVPEREPLEPWWNEHEPSIGISFRNHPFMSRVRNVSIAATNVTGILMN